MNITDIYEDSPNNYRIISGAPKDIDEGIRYYLDQFDVYDKRAYSMEWAIINYGMARMLLCDKTQIKANDFEGRAKRIENSLYYFNQALEVFTYRNYPVMFALINMYMAKLFRERSLLFSKRSFLSHRGSPEESLEFGLDQAMEALPVLSLSKTLLVEHALCCLEIGHLYVLLSEYPHNAHDHSLREQAITYLERVLTLLTKLPAQVLYIPSKGKAHKWSFEQIDTYPLHVAAWMDGFGKPFVEGCAYYLLGRVEQGWGLVIYGDDHPEEHVVPSGIDNSNQMLDPTTDTITAADRAQPVAIVNNAHIYQAYNHFSTAVRPSLLPTNCNYWADSHHRTALLIVKYPELVDPDYFTQNMNRKAVSVSQTFLFMDMAIDHFHKALKCTTLSKTERMDLHFHLAQTHMMKLQRVIDQVPYNQSVTRAIRDNDGLETMTEIENNLKQALQRVTAANNQSVQDAYLYFYASLKLAEYRMLQAACAPSVSNSGYSSKTAMTMMDREENLYDAMGYLIDACIARPLADNIDLHYIATGQLAQILVAVKRPHAAAKAYGKLLFCMSVLINRSAFNYTKYHFEKKLKPDATRHVSTAFSQAVKEIHWIKLHLGPMKLHEKVAPGYANWSFEDIPSVRHAINSNTTHSKMSLRPLSSHQEEDEDDNGLAAKFSDSPAVGGRKMITNATDADIDNDPYRVMKPVPPKGVPPLQLPPTSGTKKVFVDGVHIPESIYEHHNNLNESQNDDNISAVTSATKKSKPTIEEFKPPAGPVPLTALGHSIPHEIRHESEPKLTTTTQKVTNFLTGAKNNNDDNDKRLPNSPYTYRLRLRVPPLQEMREIDKENRVAFSMGRGKIAYLIPKRAPMIVTNAAGAKKQEEFRKKVAQQREGAVEENENDDDDDDDDDAQETENVGSKNAQYLEANRSIASGREKRNAGTGSVVSGITAGEDAGDDEDDEIDNEDDEEENGDYDEEKEDDNSENHDEQEDGENARDALLREGRPRSQRIVRFNPPKGTEEDDDYGDDTTVESKNRSNNKKKRSGENSGGGLFGIFFSQNKKQKTENGKDAVAPVTTLVKETPEKSTKERQDENDEKPIENAVHQKKVQEEARNKQGWIKRMFMSPFFDKGKSSNLHLKPKERYDPHDDPNAAHDATNEPVPIHQRYNVDLRKFYDSIGFWASKPTFYAFMLHSRHDRLQTVAIGKELQVLDGRRTAHIFYHTKPKYLKIFHQLRTRLREDCEKIIAPPLSLKELSQLPFGDLQILFRSHAKLAARLDDMEHFLFFKITKVDYFLPLVTSAPVFSRDIGELDVSLLNVDTLMSNVVFEKNLQSQEEAAQSNKSVSGNDNASIGNATSTTKPGNHHTAIKVSGQSLYKTPGKKKNSDNASVLTMSAAEKAQRAEEKEDVLAGKMTFSLSQSLDGCGYMLEGQQGAKDMLIRHLAHDECLFLWQLPSTMTQKLTVILVWRENSLSKHQFYSAKAAYAASQDDAEKRKKHGERVHERMKTQQKATQKAFGHQGIVMEMAQCDLTATHFLQFLQRYLDALHAKPAPVRMTLASDALHALSCALCLSELFLMIPLHVRSLVMCCPPVMRLVPWHLLLVETSDFRNIIGSVDDLTKGINAAKTTAATGGNNRTAGTGASPGNDTGSVKPEEPRIVHLCEKYCVRLGPSLTLFELCSNAATQLRHSVGMHRLCAVDGDDRLYARSHPSMANTSGIRGADLETLCAASLWSADPDDARILRDFSSTKVQLKTSSLGDLQHVKQHLSRFDEYCNEIKLKRATATNPNPDKGILDEAAEEEKAMKEHGIEPGAFSQPVLQPLLKKMMKNVSTAKRFQHGPTNLKIGKVEDDDDDDDENHDDGDETAKERRLREQMEDERREFRNDTFYLTSNRVCHIAARKALYYDDFDYEQDIEEHLQEIQLHQGNKAVDFEDIDALYHEHDTAAFQIVREHQYLHIQQQHMQKLQQFQPNSKAHQAAKKLLRESAADGYFTAKDIVQQWYMKNNALTILSRFGYCDDLVDLEKQARAVQHTATLIEALHLAGAPAVLYPMWDTTSTPSGAGMTMSAAGKAQGTSASESGLLVLARLLFLIRFYATLPARSRDHRLSVIECVRRVQGWLRNVTANDVIAFVAKTPLPQLAKDTIIAEMEALCAASVAEDDISAAAAGSKKSDGINGRDEMKAEKEKGNRKGGGRKFFTHFLLWGSFCVSGYGGNVHHPDLTLPDEDVFGIDDAEEDILNAAQGLDNEDRDQSIRDTKREIQRLLLEARVLRMEGRVDEARVLENRVRELRRILFQRRIKAMKRFGWKAGRGFLDTIDFLDKAFLDQEEFSDDDDDDAGGYKTFLRKQKELRKQELENERKKQGKRVAVHDDGDSDDASVDLDDDLDDNIDGTKIQVDVDDGSPSKKLPDTNDQSKEVRKQKVFNPLTDHKRDPKDIAYEAWKSKVGGLNMAVKAPILKPRPSVAGSRYSTGAGASSVSQAGSSGKYNTPEKNGKLGDDNYEYNMMQKVKGGPPKPPPVLPPRNTDDDDEPLEDEEEEEEEEEEDNEDDEEDEEDDDEDDDGGDDPLRKYKKHKKKKPRSLGLFPWSKVTRNVRTYGEIVQMLSEQPQKLVEQSAEKLKKQRRKAVDKYAVNKKKPTRAPDAKEKGEREGEGTEKDLDEEDEKHDGNCVIS